MVNGEGTVRLELTMRASYAIRAMVVIAQATSERPSPAGAIATAMGIPRGFLPQVMGDLVRAGLVTARLGRAGGYLLARPAASIAILDIIRATEGETGRRTCVLRGVTCGIGTPCAVHDVFAGAEAALVGELAAATLADVVRGGAAIPGDAEIGRAHV